MSAIGADAYASFSHQDRANELKIEAYRDDGYVSQLKGMLTGLSWRIYAIFRQVRKIRSTISVCRLPPLRVRRPFG